LWSTRISRPDAEMLGILAALTLCAADSRNDVVLLDKWLTAMDRDVTDHRPLTDPNPIRWLFAAALLFRVRERKDPELSALFSGVETLLHKCAASKTGCWSKVALPDLRPDGSSIDDRPTRLAVWCASIAAQYRNKTEPSDDASDDAGYPTTTTDVKQATNNLLGELGQWRAPEIASRSLVEELSIARHYRRAELLTSLTLALYARLVEGKQLDATIAAGRMPHPGCKTFARIPAGWFAAMQTLNGLWRNLLREYPHVLSRPKDGPFWPLEAVIFPLVTERNTNEIEHLLTSDKFSHVERRQTAVWMARAAALAKQPEGQILANLTAVENELDYFPDLWRGMEGYGDRASAEFLAAKAYAHWKLGELDDAKQIVDEINDTFVSDEINDTPGSELDPYLDGLLYWFDCDCLGGEDWRVFCEHTLSP
ncbi:MAG: hypothetical protein ACYDBS_03235, partial [Acidimicrobiales bacterium]